MNPDRQGLVHAGDEVWFKFEKRAIRKKVYRSAFDKVLFDTEKYLASASYFNSSIGDIDNTDQLKESNSWQVRQWASEKRHLNVVCKDNVYKPTVVVAQVPSASRYGSIQSNHDNIEFFIEKNPHTIHLGRWTLEKIGDMHRTFVIRLVFLYRSSIDSSKKSPLSNYTRLAVLQKQLVLCIDHVSKLPVLKVYIFLYP